MVTPPKTILFQVEQWRKHHMQRLGLIVGALALLSTPIVARSAAAEKPIVVAEEGNVSIGVAERDHDRDRYRDRNHHRRIVVLHRDRDDHEEREEHHHRRVLIIRHNHDHD